MKSIVYRGVEYKHGDYVKCRIHNVDINDARISIEASGIFICQNHYDGAIAEHRFGYTYSWCVGSLGDMNPSNSSCYDLERCHKIRRDYVYQSDDGETAIVLAVVDNYAVYEIEESGDVSASNLDDFEKIFPNRMGVILELKDVEQKLGERVYKIK